MLEVAIQSKTYSVAGGGRLQALSEVAFSVGNGEFVCLTGPSGCGKTTTLRLVLGLERDFEGRIERDDQRVAAAFQEPRLLPWRTVEDNIRLALPPELAGTDLDPLYAELGLTGVGRLYPGELSLGMARRASLARAFAVQPSLLLLDEPFVSLDEATAARLRLLLMKVWQARPMAALMVTHNLREAAELADRIVVLSARPGRVVGVHNIATRRGERNAATIDAILRDLAALTPSGQP
jgi:NitT/TauT family transport system ATP-binding protein